MKFKHPVLIFLSGFVWLCAGALLLTLGMRFILQTVREPILTLEGFSISRLAMRFVTNPTQAILFTLLGALSLGYLKGRMMLAQSVAKQVARIRSLPNPASLKYLYGKSYLLLIFVMILLGLLLRVLPISLDTRGFVDVVIGSALINGSMLYFRQLSSSQVSST